jgi:hypothetical protein
MHCTSQLCSHKDIIRQQFTPNLMIHPAANLPISPGRLNHDNIATLPDFSGTGNRCPSRLDWRELARNATFQWTRTCSGKGIAADIQGAANKLQTLVLPGGIVQRGRES